MFVSIVVSISACHAGDRGSIPRWGDVFLFLLFLCPRHKDTDFQQKLNFMDMIPETSLILKSYKIQNKSMIIRDTRTLRMLFRQKYRGQKTFILF